MKGASTTVPAASIDDALVAFTEGKAGRLAGVSIRRLRYWAETGLVAPSVSEKLGPRSSVRLYGFHDLLELLIVAELRASFSLQYIRLVVERVRTERPLTEVRFAISEGEMFFQRPDGTWEGARRPGQYVLSHVLELEPLRRLIRSSVSERSGEMHGQAERRRMVHGSKPIFVGTRTPVATIFPYLARRYTTAQILEAFPHLSRADVRLARAEFRERGAA